MQEKVIEYANKNFNQGSKQENEQHWKEFMKLMRQWDGRPDYWQSFYELSVLQMKKKEVLDTTF